MVGQIRTGEGYLRVRENCLKYLKRRWSRKEGRANKDFKMGGKLGQGVGVLKKGVGWNPLTSYVNNKRKHERKDEKNVIIKV